MDGQSLEGVVCLPGLSWTFQREIQSLITWIRNYTGVTIEGVEWVSRVFQVN